MEVELGGRVNFRMGRDAQGVNEAAAAIRDQEGGYQRTPIRRVAGKGNKNSFHDV